MRRLPFVVFLLLASAAAFGQAYCDCYSYVYADPNSGEVEAYAYSYFPDCIDSCYAYVELTFGDNSSTLYQNYQDGWDTGEVELDYVDHVLLNDTYWEQSYHEVDGYDGELDWVTDTYNDSDQVSIPGLPTIYVNYVDVTGGDLASISYTASPPVLSDSQMTVCGQYSYTTNPNSQTSTSINWGFRRTSTKRDTRS